MNEIVGKKVSFSVYEGSDYNVVWKQGVVYSFDSSDNSVEIREHPTDEPEYRFLDCIEVLDSKQKRE